MRVLPSRRLVLEPRIHQAGRLHVYLGLGCSRFVRHYYGNDFCSSGYVRCFSSPGCLHLAYVFSERSHDTTRAGLPHSEIPGYASSRLTGAYRSVATSFIGLRRQGIHPAP